MKTLILLLALCSLNVTAGIVKGKFIATAKQAAICSQVIFKANFMVETKQISFDAGQRIAKGCKAYISRYDAKLNKDKQELLIAIKALINE